MRIGLSEQAAPNILDIKDVRQQAQAIQGVEQAAVQNDEYEAVECIRVHGHICRENEDFQ